MLSNALCLIVETQEMLQQDGCDQDDAQARQPKVCQPLQHARVQVVRPTALRPEGEVSQHRWLVQQS